jgi:xylan 1,4-beta-xylosidase
MLRRLIMTAAFTLAVGAAAAQPHPIVVDAVKVTGQIRSLQGVNLGPWHTQPGFPDLTAQYRDLRIDTIRAHDFFGPTDVDSRPKDRGARLVLFPDWNADPGKEESYRFGPSDRFIQAIIDCGAKVYFRLGRSFAADPTPPPDFAKFAEVARHIAMHYNAGWAGGHHYGIQYWEVWNEPNIQKDWVPSKGLYLFWSGTREQYFELYAQTARALKAFDPKLKVGGPGLAEGARVSPWREGFVRYCAERKAPLDFLSWHHYHGDSSDPWDMVRVAQDVRRLLDAHGLRRTESHVNEWNLNLTKGKVGPQHQASMESAAFTACALIYLQDAPLDLSHYYTGNAGNMGSFETNGAYRKKAYALKATGAMLDTPQRLAVSGADTMGLAVLAGRAPDNSTVQVLISNYQIQQPQGPPRQSAPPGSRSLERRQVRSDSFPAYALRVAHLPWGEQPFTVKRYRTDGEHDFALVEQIEAQGGTLEVERPLAPPAIELITLRRH